MTDPTILRPGYPMMDMYVHQFGETQITPGTAANLDRLFPGWRRPWLLRGKEREMAQYGADMLAKAIEGIAGIAWAAHQELESI